MYHRIFCLSCNLVILSNPRFCILVKEGGIRRGKGCECSNKSIEQREEKGDVSQNYEVSAAAIPLPSVEYS